MTQEATEATWSDGTAKASKPTRAKPAEAAKPKVAKPRAKAPISAASAAKPVKVAPLTESPTAVTNKAGSKLRCQVGRGSKQCKNPGRWPHGKSFTCSTHHRAILAGRHLDLTGSSTAVYAAPSAPPAVEVAPSATPARKRAPRASSAAVKASKPAAEAVA